MIRLALLLTLLFPAVVQAAPIPIVPLVAFQDAVPPNAVITGPTEGVPGDFIELDGTESVADFFLWDVTPSRFSDGKTTYKADGKMCRLASRPGRYDVLLVVSNGKGIALKRWSVTIAGTAPPVTPPTDPKPPVPPTKPPDPPATGMTEAVRAYLKFVTADPNKATTAKAVAKAYTTAASVGATLTDTKQFASMTELLVSATLKQRGVETAWHGFRQALAEEIVHQGPKTVPEHVALWKEIAAGLEN